MTATVNVDNQTYGNQMQFFLQTACFRGFMTNTVRYRLLHEFICHTEMWKYGGDVEDDTW
jgi:hypothetical protein